MMELVMSRVWMVIAGLVLAGVVLSSFGALDDRTREAAELEGARALASTVEALGSNGQEGALTIIVDDILPDGHRSLTIYEGSIWIGAGPSAMAVTIPHGAVLMADEERVESLTLMAGDLLIARSYLDPDGNRAVQLEKVSATNFTASTNLLHSFSVLYT